MGALKDKQKGGGQKHRKGVKKGQNREGENTEIIGGQKRQEKWGAKQEGEEKDSSHLLVLNNQIIRHAEKVHFGDWPKTNYNIMLHICYKYFLLLYF